MSRSPVIPPRATSLLDQDIPPQGAGLSELISEVDTGVGPSRRSSISLPTERCEIQSPDTLEAQRNALVAGIASDSRANASTVKLDETGRSVFRQAGFAERIDRPSDIEATTNWLKPVVQVRRPIPAAFCPYHER